MNRKRRDLLLTALRVLFISSLFANSNVSWGYDIYDYAREVCEQLGPFPSFSAFDPDLSHEIPITQNGIPLTGSTATRGSTCDRPPLLGLGDDGQAVPYSRTGRLPALDPFTLRPTEDILWMFIARRYQIRPAADEPMFEDVAIIGHNKRSGATAFFQGALSHGPKDGRKIPSPMRFRPLPGEPASTDFWLSPLDTAAIGCYKCHDSGPFMHSPYVDQVKVNNELIVPLVNRNPPGPYWFVGSEAFTEWPQPKYFSKRSESGNRCVSCHSIGNGPSSAQFIRFFAGRDFPAQVTEAYKQYPLSHYMPNVSLTDLYPTQQAWETDWGSSVDELLACKANPDDAACWTPFSRSTDPGPADAIYVDAASPWSFESGSVQFPFKSLATAYAFVPSQGTLIVVPGVYTAAATLTKPVTIVKKDPKVAGQVVIYNQ